MSGQTWWVVAVIAVVVAGVIGFFIGRHTGGTKQRIRELEADLASRSEEIRGYRKEVETHFDKTATLFVSMAGSYKDLFEHLSSGYEKLSAGSARDLFKERVTALLLDGPPARDGDDEIVLDRAAARPGVAEKDVAGAPAELAAATTAEAADEDRESSGAPRVRTSEGGQFEVDATVAAETPRDVGNATTETSADSEPMQVPAGAQGASAGDDSPDGETAAAQAPDEEPAQAKGGDEPEKAGQR